ncbi:hypothetical protein TREES_T100003900 [Tupaia chinensis]|uniref:Uncharacterized protein n=1 Tax=Tupaia chinensis TaxID=246437 RepID=L9L3Y7_TUPCH|nr:hypothetical protein TREES_T100003900 [Tupaia chinensis]
MCEPVHGGLQDPALFPAEPAGQLPAQTRAAAQGQVTCVWVGPRALRTSHLSLLAAPAFPGTSPRSRSTRRRPSQEVNTGQTTAEKLPLSVPSLRAPGDVCSVLFRAAPVGDRETGRRRPHEHGQNSPENVAGRLGAQKWGVRVGAQRDEACEQEEERSAAEKPALRLRRMHPGAAAVGVLSGLKGMTGPRLIQLFLKKKTTANVA